MKNQLFRFALVLFALALCLSPVYAQELESIAAPQDGTIKLASVSSDGVQANEESLFPSVSGNGRYVTFGSAASNLVDGDTNGVNDNFIHDLETGQTILVSVASDGTQGNDRSGSGSISADGRYIAFWSVATNLVSGDTNGNSDIFVRDLQTGQTTLASVASDGTQGNSGAGSLSISDDGRYVAFYSFATNFVSGDTNDSADIFVHDRQTGQTTRVSVASDGTQSNDHSTTANISGDGRYVVFDSNATNLVSGDTNSASDVFVHDQQTGQTTRVSVASDGTQGNNFSGIDSYSSPPITADGRYVVFSSGASNLVGEDTNGFIDIFVHDRQTGNTTLVSVASDGTQGNGGSDNPSVTSDGNIVVFHSSAINFTSGDTNGVDDIFVRNLQTGQTTLVSNAPDGSPGNERSDYPSISADGSVIGFHSHADNLISGDTNGFRDAFVYEMESEVSPSLAMNHSDGAPGSYFNVTGTDYPPNQNASVSVNGSLLGNIMTSATGTFTLTLSTTNADEGIYYVTVSVNQSATARFTLNSSDPVRLRDGSYTLFELPTGIAFTDEIFLPLTTR